MNSAPYVRFGLVLVVRPAPESHVLDRGFTAPGDRDLVIELEALSRLTAATNGANVRAAALVRCTATRFTWAGT
jgi:hypothetical protein